jgi:hypothetical protein
MRMLRSMAVLGLVWGAGCGGMDPDANPDDTQVCTGTVRGAVSADISFCSLRAHALSNGQLVYALQFDTKEGSPIDGTTVTFMATGTPRTGSVTFAQALGDLQRGEDDFRLAVGMGSASTGAASLTVDAVPTGKAASTSTIYEWFGGEAQLTFRGTGETQGELVVSLDFVPQS